MQRRHFTPDRGPRLITAATPLSWLTVLLLLLSVGEPAPAWLVVLVVLTAVASTVSAVQVWRARTVVEDRGITVDPGLGRVRRADWGQVDGLRGHRVVLKDAPDIRLPISRRQLSELREEVEARTSNA